ncbi:hypothetical protein [Fructilactobacillus fructivorans]|uniref:hypothetical protein n=1 Tax=Fructilactobacillus fructivorans TaxID=1614 RepID=UPI0002196FC7|nr:hypothetical protein [Fructilactobacillus fructivorans]
MDENNKLIYDALLKISNDNAPTSVGMLGSKAFKKLSKLTKLPQEDIATSLSQLEKLNAIHFISGNNQIVDISINQVDL